MDGTGLVGDFVVLGMTALLSELGLVMPHAGHYDPPSRAAGD
jgi:hypothetical protein